GHAGCADRGGRDGAAEFHGPGEVVVAPGGAFGAVAQLGEHVGEQGPGGFAGRVGEDGVAGQLGGEPPVARVGELAGLGDGGVQAAEGLDVPGGGGLGRLLPQVGRVAVIPAQVPLVDRLDVVAD